MMYSSVYFRDESRSDHFVILGIKCERVPSIETEGDTVTLTNTGKTFIREANSTPDWGDLFECSFVGEDVTIKFKKEPKSFKICPYPRTYKVDFAIFGEEGTKKEPLFFWLLLNKYLTDKKSDLFYPLSFENMEQTICQSCGMPLTNPEQFGTNSDGSVNQDYCIYCYKDGNFIDDVSMEEYIDMCSQYGAQAGMTNEEMKEYCTKLFPTLKRWKK